MTDKTGPEVSEAYLFKHSGIFREPKSFESELKIC